MANVLDILKPLAQPSINPFDLSQKHVYGSAPGRLDSPLFVETMPNDKFEMNMAGIMRTMTLNTPAFLRGKVTYDFYFVPYSQIWHPFNQFIDQRLDAHSTRQRGFKYVPVISLYDLFRLIGKIHETYYDSERGYYYGLPAYLKDVHGIPWIKNIFRLLDFFGYGSYYHLEDYLTNNDLDGYGLDIEYYADKYVNVFRPAAYQHIWYDAYRNKFYDNYEQNTNVYGVVEDYVGFFNFDDIECDTFAHSIIPIDLSDLTLNQRVIGLFQQRYIQYKQDVLQSALPSQQFGAVSQVSVSVDVDEGTLNVGQALFSSTDYSTLYTPTDEETHFTTLKNTENGVHFLGFSSVDDYDGDTAQVRTPHTHPVSGSVAVGSGSFDVIALKRAEALQKWRQNAMRAGNMVDDSFRAHFGRTPRYEADNNVFKLKSVDMPLNINVVETTAQTAGSGNNRVGDLGATATAVGNCEEFHYDCSDFGVIVGVQFFRPESEYASAMMDRANTLYEPFDFPTPELCNVSLSPIETRDYNFNIQNFIIGFASQYWWCKTAFDKSHGNFGKYEYYDAAHQGSYIQKGSMCFWNAPRVLDLIDSGDGAYYRSKASLYVNPDILDDVFGVVYSNPSDMLRLADNLVFNTFFNVKVLRPLTVIGLPQF